MARPPDPEAGAGTSLYVHVPFCVVKCGYCDFNSYVVEDRTVHDRFLDALDRELAEVWRGRPVTVFLGGGTPSLLDAERFARLFAVLAKHVDLHACAEVSMEANPESLTVEKARIARAAGVNRASIGVQSFDEAQLRFLDRAHTAEGAERAFAALREAGFENISLDLMFGIPGEMPELWTADLERALTLGPDHLSCYNLTFEPGTRLTHAMQQGRVVPNDEERDRLMFLHTRERLAAAGFVAYEVSNFAGRGGPCRHNDHYWLQGDYVGVGPGASSHRAGVRTTNLKTVDSWARAALDGLPCAASAETLHPAQRAGEALWLGIRRADGVDLARVEARLDWPVRAHFAATIDRQVQAGMIMRVGDRVRLTQAGLLLADRVGSDYLQ
ncbi:MAG: radical SAM family heme chaperone HemW [Planctomycetes bacterium]|nr:radical SAM family heme chaperone HemW [Planctomycetota bacterium]MCC7397442.1 radical SAM family heme chaperone HemW [Planctomycetota bacterium]